MNKIKNTRGFTLAELLAIIILTSILVTLAIRSADTNSKKREMFLSNFNQVITLFKTARNMAMSNEQVSISLGSEPFVPEGGFGIHVDIDNKIFTLFADTHDGTEVDKNIPNGPNGRYDNDFDVLISNYQSFTITDELIEIQGVKADNDDFDSSENEIVVIFKPSDGEMIINKNDGNNFTQLEITFISPVANRKLIINKISKFINTEIVL